jgi:hypothetical protein
MAEAAQTGRNEIDVEKTPEAVKAMQAAWDNRNDKGNPSSLSNDKTQNQSDKGGTGKSSTAAETQKMIDSLTEGTTNQNTASEGVNVPVEQSTATAATTGNAGAITDEGAAKDTTDKKYWDAMLGKKQANAADTTVQEDQAKAAKQERKEIDVENSPEGIKGIRSAYYESLHPTEIDNTQKVKDKVNAVKDKVDAVKNAVEAKKRSIHNEFNNADNTINENSARKIAISNLESLTKPETYTPRKTVDATELPVNAPQQILPKGATEEQKQQILAKAYDKNVKNQMKSEQPVKTDNPAVQKAVEKKQNYDDTLTSVAFGKANMDKAVKKGDVKAMEVNADETAQALDYLYRITPQEKIPDAIKQAYNDYTKTAKDIDKKSSEIEENAFGKEWESSEADKAKDAANTKLWNEVIQQKTMNEQIFVLLADSITSIAQQHSNDLGTAVKDAQAAETKTDTSNPSLTTPASEAAKGEYSFDAYNQELQEMAKADPVYAKAYTNLKDANDMAEKIKAGDMKSTGELSKLLSDAREKLNGVKKDSNFSKKMNTQIAVIAAEAYIGSQAYAEGYNADNHNVNVVTRIGQAYNGMKSGKASFGDAMAYVAGVGNGNKYATENQKGVNKLRDIAIQTAFGTNYISDETKGALLSSVMEQESDDSKTGRVAAGVGTVITNTSAAAALALGGFSIPAAVAVLSYCAYQDSLKVGKIGTYEARQNENERRLAEMDANGNIKGPSATNSAENIYNTMEYGAGKDIANVESSMSEVVGGFISAASGNVAAGVSLIGKGMQDLMKIESTKQAVNDFVGKTGYGAEGIAELTNLNEGKSNNLDTVVEKKNKDTGDIQVEEASDNKNEGDKGKFNQPGIDSDTLKWLVRSNPQIYGKIAG